MSGHVGFYCMWSDYRKVPCAKPATHGTLLGEAIYYLCTYHAGRARRDGWRGVRKLKRGNE